MKCHVPWRHLVWRSDSLHRGTFFVHPFFSPFSPPPPPSTLSWMICCYNPFQYLNFFFKWPCLLFLGFYASLYSMGLYEYVNSCRPLSYVFFTCCFKLSFVSYRVTSLQCMWHFHFFAFRFRRFRKIAKNDPYMHRGCPSLRLPVCPSLHMEHHGS